MEFTSELLGGGGGGGVRESRKLSGIQKSLTRLYSSKHVPLIHFQIIFFKSNLHSILTKKKKKKRRNCSFINI